MTTKMSIANLALLRAGQTVAIATWPETTTTYGVAMNTLYDTLAGIVLGALPWPFAKRTTTLQLSATGSDPEWQFSYALPADFLHPIRLVTPYAVKPPFVVEGTFLLCNVGVDTDGYGPALRYIRKDAVDPQVVDPPTDYVDCLSWRLAAEYTVTVVGRGDVSQAMLAEYNGALRTARKNIGRQNQRDLMGMSEEYIKARNGGSATTLGTATA